MTKPHNDRIEVNGEKLGYSIRVGRHLPEGGANLAYVHTPEMTPQKNLLITDLSQDIPENTAQGNSDTTLFPGESFLLRGLSSSFYSPSRNIELTDEFSIPKTAQETPLPLYYRAELEGLFDASGSSVTYYTNGYIERPIRSAYNYSQISQNNLNNGTPLLYLGSKIKITRADGSPLSDDFKYKVQLIKQSGEGVPKDAFRIVLYTNFRGNQDQTFVVHYERYKEDGTHSADHTEILNAYPFFTEIEKERIESIAEEPKVNGQWRPELGEKNYALKETKGKGWEVYAPSQVIVADNIERPAHQFRYRIKGKLKTKFSTAEPGSINIGIAYLNDSVFNAENLIGVLKRINEHPLKPPYLSLQNPHHPYVNEGTADIERNAKYWTVDLSMPTDYLNDYDLIIMAGYGSYDTSYFNDSLRSYLENGGILWIDNAGSGSEVLNLENFITNIGFSPTETSSGSKGYGINEAEIGQYEEDSLERQAIERLYRLKRNEMLIGYPGVDPKFTFGAGEDESLWTKIVRYSGGDDPCLIKRTIYDEGQILASNCGIFRALANKDADDIRLVINIILACAEEKVVNTPWIHDYVYHRDNLFRQEYKNGNQDIYIDDKSDMDSTQIVSKKIINQSVRDALIPYTPSSYYRARGTFKTEVKADTNVSILNNDFEVGGSSTTWASSGGNVLPGWGINITSGSPIFEHTSLLSQRGSKAIKITADNEASGYWYASTSNLASGTYKAAVWVKTDEVIGGGASISIYKSDGTFVSESNTIRGTRDWTRLELVFGLTSASSLNLRIGFNGASAGSVWFDYIELASLGSVFMTPENDGSALLYAYAGRPLGESFDLQREGFTNTDVTVYDPEIRIRYTIRSFVYHWNNTRVRYERLYGNQKTYVAAVRRSDGPINLGLLTTLVPAINSENENGEYIAEWNDKSKVFFDVQISSDQNSRFVNVGFFNTQTGQYFYSESGENIIGYNELFNPSNMDHIILQGWTDYYTIRATKRRYAVRVKGDERIYLEYPSTVDNRDCWFIRVHNGQFTKQELNYQEYKFRSFYEGRQFGTHQYSLPEYDRQIFKPGQPFRRIKNELCEYVNDTTIRLQNTPLYIQSGKSRGEILEKLGTGTGTIYRSQYQNWRKSFTPKVYVDVGGNDIFTIQNDGYDIDYENGLVIFEERPSGRVKVDYDYNNLSVYKRTYASGKIKMEHLQPYDGRTTAKTFISKHQNWLLHPTPILYKRPYGEQEPSIVPVETYQIDYERGIIEFKEDTADRIYADYSYSMDKALEVEDYDIQSGLIHLASPISFRDEIYAHYSYEENFVEYRGYYDEELGKFVSLDLNPSEGHYYTAPIYRKSPNGDLIPVKYENAPTAKLMNKEIYLYLLPYSNSFGRINDYTIRHCFSKQEWLKIQKTMPGVAQLLGIVQLREHTKASEATVLDTRVRGGGLKTSISESEIKKRDPLAANYWDIGPWDGIAYYKNGVLIIKVPKKVLRSQGGQFTEKEVTDIIRKYVAYGVYYIIEYV